jgi:hypothetical protein
MSRNGLILMVAGVAAIYLNARALNAFGYDPLMAFMGLLPLTGGLLREVR